jgi:hypothetical protein
MKEQVPASKYVHDTGVPRLYFCERGEALRQIERGKKKEQYCKHTL